MAYQLNPDEWKSFKLERRPDLALFFDLPVEIAFERMHGRKVKTQIKDAVFEKKEFLEKVRRNFLLLPRHLEDNIKVLEVNRSPKDVFDLARREVERFLGN